MRFFNKSILVLKSEHLSLRVCVCDWSLASTVLRVALSIRSLDRAPKKTKSRQETEQWSEGGMLFMMGVHVDDFMRVPCVVSLQHVAHSIDGFGIST